MFFYFRIGEFFEQCTISRFVNSVITQWFRHALDNIRYGPYELIFMKSQHFMISNGQVALQL